MKNNLDMELRLLAGLPIYANDICINNMKLVDIIKIGYTNYSKFLNIVSLTKELIEDMTTSTIDDNQVFFFIMSLMFNSEFSDVFLAIFRKIFNDDSLEVKICDDENIMLLASTFSIHKDNFEDIFNIVKKQNLSERLEEEQDNPANDKARQLLNKRKEMRKKLQSTKNDENASDINLVDLISILASGMKMSINEVIQYDMYQFNDQFNRLRIFKDFDVNIRALLAGAKKEDIEFKHWISKNNLK